MTLEDQAEALIKKCAEQELLIKYLKKTNLCIAKNISDGQTGVTWVMRKEFRVLSAINAVGGLTQYKLALLNSLKDKFINSKESCEFELENMIYSLENEK